MQREIQRFHAEADNGATVTVVGFQEFVEARGVGQAPQWLKGRKHFELDDGTPVNYIDADTFQVVTTDQIVRKIG